MVPISRLVAKKAQIPEGVDYFVVESGDMTKRTIITLVNFIKGTIRGIKASLNWLSAYGSHMRRYKFESSR